MVLKKVETNKDGEVLKTKEGVELVTYKFEDGDVFVPEFNKVYSKSHKAKVDGKTKTITTHKLACKVKGFNVDKKTGKEEVIFVTLTPAQNNTIQKKLSNKELINQALFNAYIYKDDEENEYIGVGYKVERIPAKSFDELEESKSDEKEETKEE